jgi:NACHT domain
VSAERNVRAESEAFESEVRRIARQLWPEGVPGNAVKLDGFERDALFVTQDSIHLVEATISRQRDKAVRDGEKLRKGADKLQKLHPEKAVKGWFITRDSVTADQQEAIRKLQPLVVAQSMHQFRARLIDGREYLQLRQDGVFGSAQDPDTNSSRQLPEYIPLGLLEPATEQSLALKDVTVAALEGARFVLLADFGAGKSMTLRQLFLAMRTPFVKNESPRFPIHLNLREHHGQTDPAEALERHARNIGFAPPSHVVRAWRSGLADLLLDGFDELGTAGWAGRTKRIAQLRYSSMALVRHLVEQTPEHSSIVIAGRDHFFDSDREMRTSLGLTPDFRALALNQFTDDQVRAYLRKRGLAGAVPAWIPARPLLLGYLAARGFLQEVIELGDRLTPEESWDELLDRICGREAGIDAGLDGEAVRSIIEHLASRARATADGRGPLVFDDYTEAFRAACGYPPDDRGVVLLQRLPGLGLRDQADDSRQFIDEQLADTARTGDVQRFLIDPFNFETNAANWGIPLGDLGVGVLGVRARRLSISAGQFRTALERASAQEDWGVLTGDLVRVAMRDGVDLSAASNIYVRETDLPDIELDPGSGDLSRVEFQDCVIGTLEIDPQTPRDALPRFVRCLIGTVEGRVSESDLPADRFVDCEIEGFGEIASTTAGLMSLQLSSGVRVLLTVLKKLYLQRGSGRKENALSRGLDQQTRRLVPDVLREVEKHGLATRTKSGTETIWLPVRSSTARVNEIIAAPSMSNDPLIAACKDI